MPNSSSSLEVSSTSNQPKHLRCLFCGPIVPSVGPRKGIITYKTRMGFSFFKNILSYCIGNCGVSGLINVEKQCFKKKSNLTPSNISNIFAIATPYSKDDPNQK